MELMVSLLVIIVLALVRRLAGPPEALGAGGARAREPVGVVAGPARLEAAREGGGAASGHA